MKLISGALKLDVSQWKVDKNIPKLGIGSIYMCDWEIWSDLVKAATTKNWGSNHRKLTICGYQQHFLCMKTR